MRDTSLRKLSRHEIWLMNTAGGRTGLGELLGLAGGKLIQNCGALFVFLLLVEDVGEPKSSVAVAGVGFEGGAESGLGFWPVFAPLILAPLIHFCGSFVGLGSGALFHG